MSCPEGYRPCGRGCGGCVSDDDDGMHDSCGGGDRVPGGASQEPLQEPRVVRREVGVPDNWVPLGRAEA